MENIKTKFVEAFCPSLVITSRCRLVCLHGVPLKNIGNGWSIRPQNKDSRCPYEAKPKLDGGLACKTTYTMPKDFNIFES